MLGIINSENAVRDYDKEPLVIEDYNVLFMWLMCKYIILPLTLVLFLIEIFIHPLVKDVDLYKLLIFIPIAISPVYSQYNANKGKRKIVFSNTTISYVHDKVTLNTVSLNQEFNTYLSFQNYYHQSQDRFSAWYYALIFFIGLLITQSLMLNMAIFIVVAVFMSLAFQFTKLLIMKENYNLFHALLLISKKKVISVPLLKKQDFDEVKEYLVVHGIDIETLPKYFKPFYVLEKIDIHT